MEKVQLERLTPEEWREIADQLTILSRYMCRIVRKQNEDNLGEQDAKELWKSMKCAVTAVLFVGDYASDKCLVTERPNLKEGNTENEQDDSGRQPDPRS